MTEKLLEVENETVMKVAELEKQLLQKDKDLVAIRVRNQQPRTRTLSEMSCYVIIINVAYWQHSL